MLHTVFMLTISIGRRGTLHAHLKISKGVGKILYSGYLSAQLDLLSIKKKNITMFFEWGALPIWKSTHLKRRVGQSYCML